MTMQVNFCPFCGNEQKVLDHVCPFCNRDLSFFFTDRVLEVKAARIILSCLEAMPHDFGRYVLASVLKGSASSVVIDNDLDRNPFYGDLGKLRKRDIINMIDDLIDRGFVDAVLKEEEIFIITLSASGLLALEGKEIPWVPLPFTLAEHMEPLFTSRQKAVMPELRSMRMNIALANNIPPYMVFTDDTLKDIVLKLPTTMEEILNVKGIKEVKAKKYSREILETVIWALDDYDKRDGSEERDDFDPMDLLEDEGGEGAGFDDGYDDEYDDASDSEGYYDDDESDENDDPDDEAGDEDVHAFARIPLKRIAVSRETGERLNVCRDCGGFYPLDDDLCPRCNEGEGVDWGSEDESTEGEEGEDESVDYREDEDVDCEDAGEDELLTDDDDEGTDADDGGKSEEAMEVLDIIEDEGGGADDEGKVGTADDEEPDVHGEEDGEGTVKNEDGDVSSSDSDEVEKEEKEETEGSDAEPFELYDETAESAEEEIEDGEVKEKVEEILDIEEIPDAGDAEDADTPVEEREDEGEGEGNDENDKGSQDEREEDGEGPEVEEADDLDFFNIELLDDEGESDGEGDVDFGGAGNEPE